MFKVLFFTFLLLLNSVSAFSQAATNTPFDHSHSLWTEILTEIVSTQGSFSRVDYHKLKNEPSDFHKYLIQIESVSEAQFQQFSHEQKLAFLINYYNAHQIQQVLDNYPITSIRDVSFGYGFLFSTPWKKEFFTIFGKAASLDFVEHELIRKQFSEPRIHFAVNCASIGCPPLLDQAFYAEALQIQLEHVATNFLNADERNHYSAENNLLTLSPIFKWYKDDFGDNKALQSFVARYMEGFVVKRELARIEYSDYDWNLNDTKTWKSANE